MTQPGFEIEGRFYPFPEAFRLGDPVLVAEVTGLAWDEFVELIGTGEPDPIASLGMIAVAVWQANPTWRRDKVVRYVERVDQNQLELVAGGDLPEADASPPDETRSGNDESSETSTPKPNGTPDSSSEPTQPSGGVPGSGTGATFPLTAD